MQKYAIRRLWMAIPTVIGITILIFIAMRVLPGDPLATVGNEGGSQYTLTEEEQQAARASLGLDRPLYQQYLSWMGDVVRGDLGYSFWGDTPIRETVLRRGVISMEIALLAVIISWCIGIPAGIASASRRNSWIDHAIRVVMTMLLAIPSFWIGLTAIMLLVINFGWRPPLTIVHVWEDPWRNFQMIIGPALALGIGMAAGLARLTRSAVLESLNEDYVRTARAKGMAERPVIFRHVLRNAMLPIVTASGATMGALLGGAVATETAFGVPGLGNLLVQALVTRDWMVIQNLVLIYAVIFVLINLLVDLSYGLIDPRIRYQ